MPSRLTLSQLTRQVQRADNVLLCFDYDGTLTPIRRTPRAATLSASTRATLRALHRHPAFHVAIVSGRRLSDLTRRVSVPDLYYAGNHGMELAGPGLSFRHPAVRDVLPVFAAVKPGLAALRRRFKGLLIEDKDCSISVHYRIVDPALVPELQTRIRELLLRHVTARRLHITHGKCVVELRAPAQWNKGSLVRWLKHHMQALGGTNRLLTVFVGDDITDEDAFRVLRWPAGVGIRVGADTRRTAAALRMRTTSEMTGWLRTLSRLQAR